MDWLLDDIRARAGLPELTEASQGGLDFAAKTSKRKPNLPTRTRGKGGLPPDQIVKILDVVDTREYEEIADGVFKPVRGSGTESFCARCGRPHEVHATVELADKRTARVGTGCMKGSRLEKEAKAGASAAKTIAKWEAELAALEDKAKKHKTIYAQVDSLRPPPVTKSDDGNRITFHMGDATVYHPKSHGMMSQRVEQERTWTVERVWRDKRLYERGVNPNRRPPSKDAEDLRRKLDKKKAALKRLIK